MKVYCRDCRKHNRFFRKHYDTGSGYCAPAYKLGLWPWGHNMDNDCPDYKPTLLKRMRSWIR